MTQHSKLPQFNTDPREVLFAVHRFLTLLDQRLHCPEEAGEDYFAMPDGSQFDRIVELLQTRDHSLDHAAATETAGSLLVECVEALKSVAPIKKPDLAEAVRRGPSSRPSSVPMEDTLRPLTKTEKRAASKGVKGKKPKGKA